MTGLETTPGYTNSFGTAIAVLRSDAESFDRAGFVAKAACYRFAANELERVYSERRAALQEESNGGTVSAK